MRQNKVILHQVVLVGFLLLLTVIKLILGRWTFGLGMVWWWLGAIIGFVFVFTDRLIYALVTNTGEVHSTKIKDLLAKGKLVEGIAAIISEKGQQEHLMMRSALFLAVYLVLAFFTLTSVANLFSRGFVLGLGIHLVFDLQWDFRGLSNNLGLWFYQIKRTLSANEVKGFVWTATIIFLVLSVFL